MRNLLFFILAMFAIMQSCQKSNDLYNNSVKETIMERLLQYDSSISQEDMEKLKTSLVVDDKGVLRGLNFSIIANNYNPKEFCNVMETLFDRNLRFVNNDRLENNELVEQIVLHNQKYETGSFKENVSSDCTWDLTPIKVNGEWDCEYRKDDCCVIGDVVLNN